MRRLLSTLTAALLVALTAVSVAAARPPERRVDPAPPDRTILGQCAFPVLGHIDGPEINITFFNRFGDPVRLLGVFPGNTATYTNLTNGHSLTVGATSVFHLRGFADGSFQVMVTGEGPWDQGNPITGEPGIWYQHGRVSGTFDADGNTISTSQSGTLVDICPMLA